MTSVRESIFAEIETRLNAISGVQVERLPAGDPDIFPALGIYDGVQEPIERGAGYTRHELTVTIEGFVEQADGVEAHVALNDLHAQTVAALLPEPPLGGLVDEINEGGLRVSVAELASVRRLGFGLDIIIQFSTARENPALPA
ncbi:hypothetical protein FIV32_02340 [Sphingomonadales bacterium 58]|uniref:hypothetical protein n=1 Tax=Sphingobium sp. S8 TaxID=2758385 RepID=UPI00191B0EB3|nr:hypothetical protein [Sphingobium sp. S8]MBY2957589.1 hypothetical protein [Sphingomonadales bacterium 58]CAD7335385.1 hypothetical protein SPHS8_00481 [Sphingobium sp. S8]